MSFLRRIAALLAVLAAAVVLASCSAVRVAYDNAEFLLRWNVTSYLDVHGAQADQLNAHIVAFVAWHRAHALPQYARLAAEARERVQRGVQSRDLEWGYDAAMVQVREALQAAGSEVAVLLDTLDAQQIAHLEQRIAEDNRRFAKEHLEGTREDRVRRRVKRYRDNLEQWLGPLTEVQLERVRRHASAVTAPSELRAQDRRRRQAEFIAMIRARECRMRLPAWLEAWEAGRDPAYTEAARAQTRAAMELVHDVLELANAAQREHLVARLQRYEEDFIVLAERGRTGMAPQ